MRRSPKRGQEERPNAPKPLPVDGPIGPPPQVKPETKNSDGAPVIDDHEVVTIERITTTTHVQWRADCECGWGVDARTIGEVTVAVARHLETPVGTAR